MQALSGGTSRALDDRLLDSVAASLQAAGLQELAGDVHAWRLRTADALACYRTGHAHSKAVALAASQMLPALPEAHKAWGDWLMEQQDPGAAIEHYLAAGKQNLAFSAALSAHELGRAAAILEAGQVLTSADTQAVNSKLAVECALQH